MKLFLSLTNLYKNCPVTWQINYYMESSITLEIIDKNGCGDNCYEIETSIKISQFCFRWESEFVEFL